MPIATRMRLVYVRLLPTPRIAGWSMGALAALAVMAGTGFGATSASVTPSANVLGSIALTDPVSLSAAPPVCTDALAPLDTDDCVDVSYAAGTPGVLRLGSLSGSDVQAGALQWRVTSSTPTGYRVYLRNTGTAPLLRSGSNSIADMSTTSLIPAAAVDDATHVGVALGDPAMDNEGAVAFPLSPWVTAGGQQGELFSGVPTSSPGLVIAQRASAQTNDPFTVTFAVAAIAGQQPAPGAYAGTVQLTATTI